MSNKKPYLERGADGILHVGAGPLWGRTSYNDPGEAIKTWWAGELRLGCAHRCFSCMASHPCGNAAKHDPDHNGNPTKCGHHSKAALDRRESKRKAGVEKMRQDMRRRSALSAINAERSEIIKRIAEGHNDPRGLCQDWIDRRSAIEEQETTT